MKKILLLNQGNTDNYGDIAINDTISAYFEKKGYEVHFFPFWSEEVVFGKKYNKYPPIIKKIIWHNINFVDFLNKISIKNKFESMDYSAVIIGGGELLSGHPGFNSSLKVWSDILEEKKIPLYLLGVSGDIKMSEEFLQRNSNSLKKIEKIYVRDQLTAEICKNNYKVNSSYSPDVVFGYHKIFEKKNVSSNKEGLVVVPIEFYNLIQINLNLENEELYINYLDELTIGSLENNENVIITCSTKSDQIIAKKLYNHLKNRYSHLSISYREYSTIDEYEKILSNSRKVISGRMHALILGIINGCIVDVIPFKEKLIGFGENYSNRESDRNSLENEVIETFEKLDETIRTK